jgi:hypothetical protein
MGRTRAFLQEHAFPPGVVCTERNKTGDYGASAATYKKRELQRIAASGVRIEWAFGNMPSDAEAYHAVIPNARRVLYRRDDKAYGAQRIESYAELLPEPE